MGFWTQATLSRMYGYDPLAGDRGGGDRAKMHVQGAVELAALPQWLRYAMLAVQELLLMEQLNLLDCQVLFTETLFKSVAPYFLKQWIQLNWNLHNWTFIQGGPK